MREADHHRLGEGAAGHPAAVLAVSTHNAMLAERVLSKDIPSLLVEDVPAVVGVVLPSDEANPGPGALEAQVTHGTRLSRYSVTLSTVSHYLLCHTLVSHYLLCHKCHTCTEDQGQ